MARPSKEGVRRSFYIEKELSDEFDLFCEETQRTKTKVVEAAIREYMENNKKGSIRYHAQLDLADANS